MRLCALRPDAQAFDTIQISTIPRYKTSGLSGDEWRISARIDFFRKGKLVHSQQSRNVETACRYLAWFHDEAVGAGLAYFAGDGVHCDQEGCQRTATVRYRRLNNYCNDGHKTDVPPSSVHRHFCDVHRQRGDCGFDDAAANYVEEPMVVWSDEASKP
jgi:hypothetical protein